MTNHKIYKEIFDNIEDSIFIMQFDKIVDCNRKALEMFRCKKEEIINETPYKFSADKQADNQDSKAKAIELIRKALAGKPQSFEWIHKTLDGKTFIAEVNLNKISFDGDDFIIALMHDISERKKADEIIKLERQQLFNILDIIPGMVCLITTDHHIAYANRHFKDKFGESQGRHCYEYCYGKTQPCDFCESFRIFKTGKPHQWIASTLEGTYIKAHAFPFKDIDGSPMILEIDLDITEHKKTEEVLRSKQIDLNEAQQIAKLCNWRFNLNTNEVFWSDELYQIFEIEKSEFGKEYQSFISRICAEDRERVLKTNRKAQEDGEPFEVEYRIKTASGEIKYIHENGYGIKNHEGKVVELFGIAQDITLRKKAEKALRESERKFRLVTENINDVIWISTPGVTEIIYISPGYEKIWGNSTQSLYDCPHSFLKKIHPDDLPRYCTIIEEFHAQGKAYEYEYRIIIDNGSTRWIQERGYPIYDEHGTINLMTGICTDITERKRTEEELLESEKRLEAVLFNSPDTIYTIDLATGKVDFLNQQEFCGYSRDELEAQNSLLHVIHPQDIDKVRKNWQQVKSLGSAHPLEYRMKTKKGTLEWIEQRTSLLQYNFKDSPQQIIVTLSIITARKNAEKALCESEERLRYANKATNDVIWDWDIVNDKQTWNEAGKTLFGWTDIINEPQNSAWWTSRIHPDDRERVENDFFAAVNDPLTNIWKDEYRFMKADESYSIVADKGYILRNEQGKALRMIGAMHDITNEKKSEEKMQSLLKQLIDSEEEMRKAASQQLHDQVGQNLTALSLNLHFLRSVCSHESNQTIKNRLDDSIFILAETIEQTRNIMIDLRPSVLDDYGLHAALKWSFSKFAERTNISVNYQGEELTPPLPKNSAYSIFRIVQETFHNIVKHAHAKNIFVSMKEISNIVEVVIKDDGIGFDVNSISASTNESGFGIKTMQERIRLLNGCMKIHSTPNEGTIVTITMKR